MKNEWESYINGKSSQYNFTYQDKQVLPDVMHSPSAMPLSSLPNNTITSDVKNTNKTNIPKKGGNKKYTRKSRKSVRKSVRK